MNPDASSRFPQTPPPLPGRPRRRGFPWLTFWLALLAIVLVSAGWLIVRELVPTSDPVERRVEQILYQVRKQDQHQPGARALFHALAKWLLRRDNSEREDINPSGELAALGERAHPYLIPLVRADPSPSVREVAIEVLGEGGAVRAFQPIAEALEKDGNDSVRTAAALVLGKLDRAAAPPLLLAALERERARLPRTNDFRGTEWSQVQVMISAARALSELSSTNLLPVLLSILESGPPSEENRHWFVDILGSLGDPRALPALRRSLESPDANLRDSAVRALGQLQDRASVPRLIQFLEQTLTNSPADPAGRGSIGSDVSFTRQTLVQALGQIGEAQAVPILVRAVSRAGDDHELKSFIEAFGRLGDARAVPVLREMMADHATLAGDIAATLALLGHASVTEDLARMLEAPEREKRLMAALALANLGDRTVLTNLLGHLDSGVGDVHLKNLVEALGIIGDAGAMPALRRALRDPSEEVRTQAIWSLAGIGDSSASAWILPLLGDTNSNIRFAAAFSLILLTNAAVPTRMEALFADPEPRVRTAAASCLAFYGSERAVPQLAASLRRTDDWQRMAAAMSLLKLNTPAARDLARTLEQDRDAGLRDLAVRSRESGPVPALVHLLRQGSDNHRHYAARMLLYFDDPASVPALREAIRDRRAEVRVAARSTLRRLERPERR